MLMRMLIVQYQWLECLRGTEEDDDEGTVEACLVYLYMYMDEL